MVLESIQNACRSYYDNLPQETVKGILKSAAYSFVVTSLFRNPTLQGDKIKESMYLVGAAALASLIHSLTVPIFKYMFGEQHHDVHYEFVKYFTAIGILNSFVHSFKYLKAIDAHTQVLYQSALFPSIFNMPRTMERIFGLHLGADWPIPHFQITDSPFYLFV